LTLPQFRFLLFPPSPINYSAPFNILPGRPFSGWIMNIDATAAPFPGRERERLRERERKRERERERERNVRAAAVAAAAAAE
jgi:hypothetical protein